MTDTLINTLMWLCADEFLLPETWIGRFSVVPVEGIL